MGFVTTPETGHEAIALAVSALGRLAHRGGLDADGKSGDGAGVLIQVPHALLGEGRAVAVVFAWDDGARPLVERHLGPLVEHDSARKAALVATLRAYLETGEQQQAAQRLRVHPNTLRYRLDRIREITGLDLEDPETRLNLAVALRVQSLLGM